MTDKINRLLSTVILVVVVGVVGGLGIAKLVALHDSVVVSDFVGK